MAEIPGKAWQAVDQISIVALTAAMGRGPTNHTSLEEDPDRGWQVFYMEIEEWPDGWVFVVPTDRKSDLPTFYHLPRASFSFWGAAALCESRILRIIIMRTDRIIDIPHILAGVP